MKISAVTGIFILLVGLAAAQDTVGVFNSAGRGGFPQNSFAPGSLATIAVLPLGPPSVAPRPAEPPATSVKLRAKNGGPEIAATVISSSTVSCEILIPRDVPLGQTEVLITLAGKAFPPVLVHIVRSAPAIFDGGTPGFSLAQTVTPGAAPRRNRLTDPARPGDYLTLWATGLGDAVVHDVLVELAGVPVAAAYVGASPALPGIDQINVPIPADLPDSCFVSLRVRALGAISNEATFSFSHEPGTCSESLGFTPMQLEAFEAGGDVRFGNVQILSEVTADTGIAERKETFSGLFLPRALPNVRPALTSEHEFRCTFGYRQPTPRMYFSFGAAAIERVQDGRHAPQFDLGAAIHAAGPGKSLDIPDLSGGIYIYAVRSQPATEPPFFGTGIWNVNTEGGRSAGPLQTGLQIPPPIRVGNRANLDLIASTSDLTLTWATDGYTETDLMTVSLTRTDPASLGDTGVQCTTPADAGSIVIPASMLSSYLEPGPGAELRFSVTPRQGSHFQVRLTDGQSMPGLFQYLITDSFPVALR